MTTFKERVDRIFSFGTKGNLDREILKEITEAVGEEREACAKVIESGLFNFKQAAAAIRRRGEQ
jgi:hypothetical protein